MNVPRRTLSSVLCDNVPLRRNQMLKKLKFPETAFRLDSPVLTCGDILKKSSLDFEKIAEEIVGKQWNGDWLKAFF